MCDPPALEILDIALTPCIELHCVLWRAGGLLSHVTKSITDTVKPVFQPPKLDLASQALAIMIGMTPALPCDWCIVTLKVLNTGFIPSSLGGLAPDHSCARLLFQEHRVQNSLALEPDRPRSQSSLNLSTYYLYELLNLSESHFLISTNWKAEQCGPWSHLRLVLLSIG